MELSACKLDSRSSVMVKVMPERCIVYNWEELEECFWKKKRKRNLYAIKRWKPFRATATTTKREQNRVTMAMKSDLAQETNKGRKNTSI